MNERLGRQALTNFRVWAMILLWTLSFSEGAGFGAATYQNQCTRWETGICPLVFHPLFPPQVPVSAFLGNVASLWVDGVYDVGLAFAIVIAIILPIVASRTKWYVAERVFSWSLIAIGCMAFALVGYFYEIHQTLSTGIARVPLL